MKWYVLKSGEEIQEGDMALCTVYTKKGYRVKRWKTTGCVGHHVLPQYVGRYKRCVGRAL